MWTKRRLPNVELPLRNSVVVRGSRRSRTSDRLRRIGLALYDAVDSRLELFECPACRKLLRTPVTADCGHTFCVDCLDKVKMRCVVCDADVGSMRSTNVLIQDVVAKWREIHGDGDKGRIPETADILGIEPRYCLRSGNAGLQVRYDCKENNINKLVRRLVVPGRRKGRGDTWHETRKRKSHRRNLKRSLTHADISSREIGRILRNVDRLKDRQAHESWKHVSPSDLECVLCGRCFLEPVTTRCGHTFCRGCLARVVDHGLACPLCMAPLSPFEENRGTVEAVDCAVRLLLPDEHRERLAANRLEDRIHDKDSKIPVFVCTNAFPGVACPLYVYEPRYRLLARRCLQSRTRRFAMAARSDASERFAPFGTVLEVRDAVHLRDGTSILTTVGVRRFKVVEKGEQDGYDTAKVQYIEDRTVSAERLPDLLALHQRVYSKAARWVRSLTPRVLAEVENCIGNMPVLEEEWYNLPDGPAWAWWLMPILPLSPKLQIGFLYTTDLEKRLRAIDKLLEHMKIKMRALKRNTLKYADAVENSDSCRLTFLL